MQQQTIFTDIHHAAIVTLCAKLSERIGRDVVVEYGESDDGHLHDASLCLRDGYCDLLVTIIGTQGISGPGFAVVATDGSPVAHDVSFRTALRSAQKAGALCARRNHLIARVTL